MSADGGHEGIAAAEGGSSSDGATGEADGAFLEVEPDAGAPPCADAGSLFVEVTGDGPVQTYVAGCELARVPYGGHVYFGGEGDSTGEGMISGCAVADSLNSNLVAQSSISVISSLAAVGDTDAAAIAYYDALGVAWLGSATLHITQWSPIGGTIEGSYAGTTVALSDAPLFLGMSPPLALAASQYATPPIKQATDASATVPNAATANLGLSSPATAVESRIYPHAPQPSHSPLKSPLDPVSTTLAEIWTDAVETGVPTGAFGRNGLPPWVFLDPDGTDFERDDGRGPREHDPGCLPTRAAAPVRRRRGCRPKGSHRSTEQL